MLVTNPTRLILHTEPKSSIDKGVGTWLSSTGFVELDSAWNAIELMVDVRVAGTV